MLQQRRIAEARIEIRDAIAERDDIPDLHILRARIEMAAGSPATAFAAYSDALSLDSSNREALMGVCQIGLQIAELGKASDAADRLLVINPNEKDAMLIKAFIAVLRNRGDEALGLADKVLAIAPNDEGGALMRARALFMLHRRDEALAAILAVQQKLGDTPNIVQALAEMRRYRDEGQEMADLLAQLRKLEGNFAVLTVDEANARYKLGDKPAARRLLMETVLDKQATGGVANAVARLWREHDPAAFDEATARTIAAKGAVPVRQALAAYALSEHRPAIARILLDAAPKDVPSDALRAQLAVQEGQVDAGLAQAESILADDTTNCEALLAKAMAFNAKRNPSAAIIAAQQAAAQCPQLVPAHLALAQATIASDPGNATAIELAYRHALENNPHSIAVVRAYGDWLARDGRLERSVGVARSITKAAPAQISGWRYYLERCRAHPASECVSLAEAGLRMAERRFYIDPPPGEVSPVKLFGVLS